MAQIINRKNPKIINSVRAKGFAFVSVKPRFLFLSKPAALLCNAHHEKFIHFINDSNYWAFYINSDSDGFPLTADHNKNGGYLIYNAELVRLFRNSVGAVNNDRFFVTESNTKQGDNKIFEIQTIHPVAIIMDKVKRMDSERKYVLSLIHKKAK
jgi:hypothetical protein